MLHDLGSGALDYDLADNPWAIRQIHDEVREVSPGLFLGPAMWKTEGAPAFVLWFALDTRDQARPIGARLVNDAGPPQAPAQG